MSKPTDNDIETLAKTIFTCMDDVAKGRVSYLRSLVATIQADLPRKADQRAQLAALQRTHERFYEIILRTAEEFVPKGTKERGVELHRRATFARTAASALRVHVRAGGDINALKATVTKAGLRARASPAVPTPRRLKGQAERRGKSLIATLMGLAEVDKEAARAEMQLIVDQLTAQLEAMATEPAAPVRRRRQSAAHHETHVGVQ